MVSDQEAADVLQRLRSASRARSAHPTRTHAAPMPSPVSCVPGGRGRRQRR